MTAPTKAQIERARAIVDRLYPGSGNGIAYEAALAAIIETQEEIAKLVEHWGETAATRGPALVTRQSIAAAIRDGSYREGA